MFLVYLYNVLLKPRLNQDSCKTFRIICLLCLLQGSQDIRKTSLKSKKHFSAAITICTFLKGMLVVYEFALSETHHFLTGILQWFVAQFHCLKKHRTWRALPFQKDLSKKYFFKHCSCRQNSILYVKRNSMFFAGNTWYFEQVLFLWKTPHLSNENCVSQTLHIFNWQLYLSKEYFKYKQKICWMLPAFLNLTLHWFNPCFIFGRCVLYIKHCPGGILHPLKKDACFEWTSFI